MKDLYNVGNIDGCEAAEVIALSTGDNIVRSGPSTSDSAFRLGGDAMSRQGPVSCI